MPKLNKTIKNNNTKISKIFLKPISLSIIKDINKYSQNSEFFEFLGRKPHQTLAETKNYIKLLLDRAKNGYEFGEAYYWGIHLKSNNKCIGTFGLIGIDWKNKTAQIAKGISFNYWGTGIIYELYYLIYQFSFKHLKLKKLYSITSEKNMRNIISLQKSCFTIGKKINKYKTSTGIILKNIVRLEIDNKDVEYKCKIVESIFLRKYSSSLTNIDLKKLKSITNNHSKFPNNELKNVISVLDTESVNQIDFVEKLEKKFCEIFKVKYAIACNSGTSGLHASLASLDLKKDDEVIVPALTVVMDSYAAIHQNAIPVFADVDEDTFLINENSLKKLITKKTKAIIVVSLQGAPVNINPILKIAKKNKITVIEDNAQDFGGKYQNKISGTNGDIGVWSFENKKHLSGATEGGIITTNNKMLAEKIRKFAGIGYKNMTAVGGRTSLNISTVQDPDYERFDTIGLNYRMPQIVAAVCFGQLENYKAIVNRRIKVAKLFRKSINKCDWLIEQKTNKKTIHTHYTFAVKYLGNEKFNISWKKFYNFYKSLGGDGFYGACVCPHKEPSLKKYFRTNNYKMKINTPVAERIQKQIMQFKTNYRNIEVAEEKTLILKKVITIINNNFQLKKILFKNHILKNLKLIDLNYKYLNDFYEYSSDKKFYKHLEYDVFNSKSVAKDYLSKLIDRSNEINSKWWFIFDKNEKKVIGTFGIINIDFSDNSCEIAYGVSSKYSGRGIATQVTSYIVNVIFEKLKFNRIYAITHEKNIASIKMLKKCNFVKEKIIKSSFVKNNKISDNLLFSIVQNK